MNKKLKQAFFGVAAMLFLAATSVNAQTAVVIAGSSALYLESGQASYSAAGCAWSTSSKVFTLVDSRFAPAVPDTATAWVTWVPAGGGCAAGFAAGTLPTVYLSTDSTVGVRCFFANPRCTITTTVVGGTGGNNQLPGVTDTAIPATVVTAISGQSVSVVATDIRPEDAKFATLRTLTGCGTPLVAGSQYLGMGYASGQQIQGSSHQSQGNGGGFNVGDFNLVGTDPYGAHPALPGTFTVTPVGAAPELVIVNPSDAAGFGSLLVTNINRSTLAGYLDGTYGATSELIPQPYGSGGPGSTVYIREPLSGTYNVMEYAIPNSVENQTSQEVGLASLNAGTVVGIPFPPFNCSAVGGVPALGGGTGTANPLDEKFIRGSGVTSYRERAIGTGNMVKAVRATPDSLGYAFWSAANFSAATAADTKYLTVDGIDPIQQNWVDGLVPTTGNGLLGNVSLAHVKDGSYPIWSVLRFVSDTSGAGKTVATNLATAALNFLSPFQPDFVPLTQLSVLRSHFAPPGVNFPIANAPCNGSGACVEAGGDVGGLVTTKQADGSYNADNGVATGNVGHRQ